MIGICALIFLLTTYEKSAFAAIGDDIVMITSTSHPVAKTETTINVYFNYANRGAITGFYYTVTTASSYTMTTDDVMSHNYKQLTSDATMTADGPFTDDDYYFYIAAYYIQTPPLIFGPTTREGPLTVDTKAPTTVSVNGPSTTENSLITLTIQANEDINKVCISETGFGVSCVWKDLTSENYNYTLKSPPESGEKDYSLYVQVKDIAGNQAQATQPSLVTYIAGDDEEDDDQTVSCHSIPTLSEWGIILLTGLLLSTGVLRVRQAKTIRS
jgi:hypothetical protein